MPGRLVGVRGRYFGVFLFTFRTFNCVFAFDLAFAFDFVFDFVFDFDLVFPSSAKGIQVSICG